MPLTPSIIRATTGSPLRGGMQSVSRTVPDPVTNSVSRISVSGRYRRLTRPPASVGAIRQCPCRSSPSSAAKHAWESNLGRQSQSMEPSVATSAAVCRSPMSA